MRHPEEEHPDVVKQIAPVIHEVIRVRSNHRRQADARRDVLAWRRLDEVFADKGVDTGLNHDNLINAVRATQDACYLLVSIDRKSTRLNSSHHSISYAVFCLK